MPRSDGSIIIDTKIDTSGLNKGTADIKSQFGKMSNSARETADAINSVFSKPVENAKLRVETLERELESVQAKFKEALASDDDAAAARLGSQQERVYDRLEEARRKLEIEAKAAAARQAEAEAKAAQKTEEANQKAVAAARKLRKETESSTKNLSAMEKSARRFSGRIREITTGALFFNIISSALSRLTRTIWETISSTNQMKTALSNLQGAAYTVASPLLNVLASAFTVLANAIATALSYLSQLYSLLTGKSLSAMAQTAKQMGNVSSSAGSAASNIKKVKRSLAGFDEITTLTDQSTSGGGGGGGASTPNYDFGLDSGINPAIQAIADKIKELIEPLKEIDFGPLKESLSKLGDSFLALGATIVDSLEWAWFNILVPLAKWTIEEGAPAVVNLLASAFRSLDSVLTPVLTGVQELLTYLKPVFGFIGDTAVVILQEFSEYFQKLANVFEKKGPEISGIISNIGEMISLVWSFVEPILLAMVDTWRSTFSFMGDISAVTIGLIIDILYGLTEFIAGVFTGDWKRAWSGISHIFEGFGDACLDVLDLVLAGFGTSWAEIGATVKNAINKIIGYLNGLISAMTSGLNTVIGSLNKVSFKIPDWVPSWGGKTFGLSIPKVSAPKIPYLAKGAVIPPNAPFMAMLGDQRHGTNIEAPLETIQEAVAMVMEDMTGGMMAGFEATVEVLREILEAVLGIEIGDEVIGRAVDRYTRRMALRNGG